MSLRHALSKHWPEYLIEAAGLCGLMIAACVLVSLTEYPESAMRQWIPQPLYRRAVLGIAMGATVVAIVYSPWGQRSGAHINPSITLVYWLLGKVASADALFYIVSQFSGGIAGVIISEWLLSRHVLAAPTVYYAVTLPGIEGPAIAWGAECVISFGMMLAVLIFSNRPRLNRYTGLMAGCLLALYITVEAPLSGTSMNPARTLGSAVSAQVWTALWIYFTAPLAGMLLAALVYCAAKGHHSVLCAKLHHENRQRCIFRCRYHHDPSHQPSLKNFRSTP